MSDTADPTIDEPQTSLRDALARIAAPTADPAEIAQAVDDAIGAALRIEQMARAPANSLDGDMARALAITISAGDATALFASVRLRLEQLEEQCQAMAKAAEQALCDAMHAAGAEEVGCDSHVAKRKKPTQRVEIIDPAKLPLDAFTTPKAPAPVPSKEIIRAKLLTGQVCDGAVLVDSEPAINITVRKGRSR